ncbi:hypothetical protein CRG98_005389 [Punica granatum]|uniref:UBX domain-containing protein n=1 Tax=Punica granatum TaxID=22663 RepID=A0A2I0L091_PUNGR|nr:hypothetical protein CRG98_005389 [Punica granatum]
MPFSFLPWTDPLGRYALFPLTPGEDADSIRMENSTWVYHKVSESISKYCILLQLAEGSADAANFSRIYPQNSVPCITAVGYNGVKIWQQEGFIDAENLASSLEKAWLSFHIQETTASVMAAALARTTSEPSTSQASPVTSNEEGSSLSAVPPPSDGHNQSSETTASLIIEEKRIDGKSVKSNEKLGSVEPDSTQNLPSTSRSSDVHMNIRLPDGVSLQDKFPVMSTLRTVKDYVDENRADIGSYDLATPYPRKVFNDQDSSAPDLSSQNDEGYFTFVRRVLSYLNPFSYLGSGGSGGSSSSGQDSSAGTWENPQERPYSRDFAPRDTIRSRRLTTSQFGSNIHTLKHDDDETRFRDRNSFWNGNSTQYGGNDDDRT